MFLSVKGYWRERLDKLLEKDIFLRSEVHTYATILQLHKEWDEIDEIEMRHVDDKQCCQIHHSEARRWVSFKSGHPRLLQGKKRATIVDSLLQNHKKRRRGSTLIHSYSGNNICRSSSLPDNPFSHLLVSITSTRGSPGAVSPKLQVLDSLLPQVVEKADGRIPVWMDAFRDPETYVSWNKFWN